MSELERDVMEAGSGSAQAGSANLSIQKLFDDTRKRLVETGTRNRLVHVNRSNTRGNVVNIVNERSDDIWTLLSSGKTMRFRALGHDLRRGDDNTDIVLADETDSYVEADRYIDNQLETRLGPDGLAKKLLKIAREAKTAEEEQGVNILYLALGFLTWYEDPTSAVAREAPLVLLPVELVRNAKSSTYDLRLRDQDLITNLPLQQRLSEDFGIRLPNVDVSEDWRPSAYFAQVDTIISSKANWKIDPDGMQLGFFSFSKLLMYLDLALDAWPDSALEGHELTRGLLYEGFDVEQPLFKPDDRLDDILPPDRMFHVVDADASQARVIEEVRAGRNLVVQGPPGTGKSQTITNIIAAAAKEGRTVLFVAEKMAALSVVHDRLVKTGLGDVCLELHSKSANKKAVLAEIARTLNSAQAVPATPQAPLALTDTRDRLNRIAAALHSPIGQTGETPFSVLARQARYIGMGAPAPTFASDNLAAMNRDEERALTNALLDFGSLLKTVGTARSHPFWGVGALDFQPVELSRLQGSLASAAEDARLLREALDHALSALGLPLARSLSSVPVVTDSLRCLAGLPEGESEMARLLLLTNDRRRLIEAVQTADSWAKLRTSEAAEFTEIAFDTDVSSLRGSLVAGAGSFFSRWGSAYRDASRQLGGLLRQPLPKNAAERVELVDRLLEVRRLRIRWREDEAFLSATLDETWRGERTDFTRVSQVLSWVEKASNAPLSINVDNAIKLGEDQTALTAMGNRLDQLAPAAHNALHRMASHLQFDETIFDGGIDGADLIDVAARLSTMAQSTDRYSEWSGLGRLQTQLAAGGLEILAQMVANGAMDGNGAAIELKFARAERLWREAIAAEPALKEIAALDRHALTGEFAALERKRLKENVTTILAGHLAQVPQGAMGEMKIVRGEIGKRRSHIALRRLFEQAPAALQRIKPVLLMSPISVAQYLTPGRLSFDLLVIDEASQVRPEDALGAIARARQIVVVGDQKQLPPSSFFDRLLSDDSADDDEPEDGEEDLLGGAATLGSLESILSLCEARGLSSRMLQWHYRSRDPSLIRVSNREFYDDGLILPPSPLQKDPAYGLIFTKVDGVYDKGGKRDNRKEGEAIVKRVAEHARAHPDQSLGIVTFSSAQKNTITELLELARRNDSALDTFLREGQSEDVFVKNIENVQGDERDVILVSVGYGPTIPGGRLTSMTFGPVNGEGGERRLNVLFTRARIRCEVFASFDPGDIDASRVSREGPRILRRFLEFAKSGQLDDPTITGEPADTPFEEDVADVIRSFGFLADPQVGSAGFRIDIGVRHPDKPGTYLLAVECDGATYHSALWARERDRLRQDVLEHLGWRFHRIWSTDWFYNRRAEIERLRAALSDAGSDGTTIRITGANTARVVEDDATPRMEPIIIPPTVERAMPPYLRAHFPITSHLEPHEAPMSILGPLVRRIVEVEGPVCTDEVARRIASCFGREKAGRRIVAAAQQALAGQARAATDFRSEGEFWFTATQQGSPPVRDRSAENGATLKADAISMLEIRAALAIAREDNAGGTDADLVRSAARLLGFRRVGSDLQNRLAEGLV